MEATSGSASSLRTLPEANTLCAAIRAADRVAVIGAGWIGTEVAASARQVGAAVVLIDPQEVHRARGHLRQLHSRRRRRRADEREVRFRAPGKSIADRPLVVAERTRVGDWEGDLIVGTGNRSAIGTLVDRKSLYVRLIHLPFGHDAERMVAAFAPMLATIPATARQTLMWDQGAEMA